jgi:hypothetical protein
MPIQFIKNSLYQSELKKRLSAVPKKHAAVGVLVEWNNNQADIDKLKNSIASKGVPKDDIHILAFVRSKEPVQCDEKHYTLKDLAWAGFPKGEAVDQFLGNKYKQFYYLCPSCAQHQKFILAQIVADFKACVYSKGVEGIFHLTIDNSFVSPSQSYQEINQLITKLTKNQ